MTWTADRHTEHLRTLAMLTRCAGNADGAKGRPGTGEARQTMVVPYRSRRFLHEIINADTTVWDHLVVLSEERIERCFTDAPARSCTCGAYALEWQ